MRFGTLITRFAHCDVSRPLPTYPCRRTRWRSGAGSVPGFVRCRWIRRRLSSGRDGAYALVNMTGWRMVMIVLTIAVVAGGCGGSSSSGSSTSSAQASSGSGTSSGEATTGTSSGQALIRAWSSVTSPTLVVFVQDFNLWVDGQAREAGAPAAPLSPQARDAAAAIALRYAQTARSATYGPLAGGYSVAYRGGKLVLRCKAKGDPPSDFCKGAQWQTWQGPT
jgi:hypothetical protein